MIEITLGTQGKYTKDRPPILTVTEDLFFPFASGGGGIGVTSTGEVMAPIGRAVILCDMQLPQRRVARKIDKANLQFDSVQLRPGIRVSVMFQDAGERIEYNNGFFRTLSVRYKGESLEKPHSPYRGESWKK